MASYPTSVKSFASRNAGDTIQPSHVNDLQDEVNAIEAGILNGTAPLNSSNSTLVHLSVTGTSTFAGAVTFNAGFTLTAPFTDDGQPRARIFHGSTQTIANNSETALTFNSEDFDPQGMHSTASNPTRLSIGAQSTGLWLFTAVCNMTAGGTGDKYIRFRKNGNTNIGSAAGGIPSGGGGLGLRIHHSLIDVISSTSDYVEVLAYQATGSGLESGNASSRIDQNEFSAVKLW